MEDFRPQGRDASAPRDRARSGSTRHGRRRAAALLAAALCAGAIATGAAAQAQEVPDDPYATGEQVASENDLDTDHTPQAEPTSLFEQVAGTAWDEGQNDPDRAFVPGEPATGVIFGSPTSFEDNLYTVAFSEQPGVGGFAGGATCEDPEPGSESGCRPVLYQYRTFDVAQGPEWRKVSLPGADEPGYVGAIAWIGGAATGQALAVGGTGVYPRREPAYREECQQWETLDDASDPDGEPVSTGARRRLIGAYGSQCDEAGLARAWLYNKGGSGSWEELPLLDPSNPSRKLTDDTTATVAADRPCATASGLGLCTVALPDTKAPLSEPERTVSREGMHGLSAVACEPTQLRELCFAGALGQIWKWEDGRFVGDGEPTGRVDAQSACPSSSSPQCGLQDPRRLRFRVRSIAFVRGEAQPLAAAVTAGCCAESRLDDYPSLLTYSGAPNPSWKARGLRQDPRTEPLFGLSPGPHVSGLGPVGKDGVEAGDRSEPRQDRPDSFYSVTVRKGKSSFYKVSAIASPGGDPEVYEPGGEPPSRLTSRYCIGRGDGKVPPLAGTSASRSAVFWDTSELTRTSLSTARLVAGDGDLSTDTFTLRQLSPRNGISETRGSPGSWSFTDPGSCEADEYDDPPKPDSVPDWAVGELRSTSQPTLGSRGLLYANPLRPSFIPDAVRPPLMSDPEGPIDSHLSVSGETSRYSAISPAELAGGEYEPTSEKRLKSWAAAPYFLLPSYGLSSIDIVGESATGWAVGDHGAILRLDAEEAMKSRPEPEPPDLGTPRASELPDDSPYAEERPPLSDGVGAVPGLAGRPAERVSEPRVRPSGAPAGGGPGIFTEGGSFATDVAMSRDGSEGWAVGPKATLYRYDGEAWSLCDYFGVRGQLPPDPACAEVAGIRLFADEKGALRAVRLKAIARVPLEQDADPANDDEFEAVAVGSAYLAPGERDPAPTILRYRAGVWEFEDAEARAAITNQAVGAGATVGVGNDSQGLSDVAFTAPDDGWMLASTSSEATGVFHYDGEQWADCAVYPTACFDPGKRLSAAPRLTLARASGSGTGEIGLEGVGERVYLFGTRQPVVRAGTTVTTSAQNCPVILYHERGEASWHGSLDGSDGSLDPGFDPGSAQADKSRQCASDQDMRVDSFMLGQRSDGAYEGWAMGRFIRRGGTPAVNAPPEPRTLRLTAGGGLQPFVADDALSDYFQTALPPPSSAQLTLSTAEGELAHFLVEQERSRPERLLRFDPAQERWEVADSDDDLRPGGGLDNLTPDGQGGFWATRVRGVQHFLHYTDRVPKPVFDEVPNPLGQNGYVTAASAGADGSFWLTTNSDALYRYDRTTGWDRVRVPGWDPGQTVTRPSQALAIAVNQSGAGVVVGEQGRIAEIEGEAVRLDLAAGTLCDPVTRIPPCGTGRDLRAAAVAPDGSAIVGGDGLALLWRPAGGEFRAIDKPDAAAQTRITGISMPAADRAWLVTDTGLLYAGRLGADEEWSWALENVNERNDLLTLGPLGEKSALRAIAVDESGQGYAVGDLGVILRRSGDSEHPWQRADTPYLDNFTSVALASDATDSAVVGGERGIVLTLSNARAALARPAEACCGERLATDQFTYMRPVVGLALLPGSRAGQVEAWAAVQGSPQGDSTLLHYASDPEETLLNPQERAISLPDAPSPRPGELSLAAFGGTRCLEPRPGCWEMSLTNEDYEVYTQRAIEEIAERSKVPGGPSLAVFTGDLTDTLGTAGPGRNAKAPIQTTRLGTVAEATGGATAATLRLRRWSELVADRLADRGVPLLGAVGGGDISALVVCPFGFCVEGRQVASAGENLAWREAMASRPAPWGNGEPIADGELRLEPVGNSDLAIDPDDAGVGDVAVDDPDGEGQLTETRLRTGGARTHYAADVVRGEQRIARLVFVDTSLRSLSAADPIQNPLEARGQLAWLQETLCTEGSALDRDDSLLDCTREPGQQAIVVSNAPTYSYGPGQNQTALDAAAFEQVLFEGNADLVVSGRIGWNGLYYALSPLVHSPEPGGPYPDRAPEPLSGGSEPIPFVVASGAGAFSPDGSGDASDGFWHGYTIVRIDPEGGETIVEQRPIFDWLHLSGEKRVLGARERLALRGMGREPIAASPEHLYEVRDDEINSAAITHRYDLMVADPERPWVACLAADESCRSLHERLGGSRSFYSAGASGTGSAQDDSGGASASGTGSAQDDSGGASGAANLSSRAEASRSDAAAEGSGALAAAQAGGGACDPYLCLPERVGTIDRMTGEVRAGNGKYPDTFAIAMLSVADHVATYPLVFRKSPSFVINPLRLPPPAPGPNPSVPSNPQAPPPPSVPKPNVPQPSLPELPALPGVPPLSAAQPPEPQPPAPPAPPPPAEQPSPLDLTVSPTALTVATPAAVIQPPTPPVNPAPPSGARREARQRQAAAQKSGADSDASQADVDLANEKHALPGAEFRRHERTRPEPSFTPLPRASDGSPAGAGLLYGGGIALAAAIMALGWTHGRPHPKRRPPEVPSPAWSRARDWR